ncbi:MAG: hypothetical protein IPL61_28305 [Myxococcales bacterium]|nr:hypothetical protein [Myxococcales bacterium]
MLARTLALTDVDPRHWRAWIDLLVPPPLRDRPRYALAVLDGDRVVRLVVAGADATGTADPAALTMPPTAANLRAAARALGVGAVVALDVAVVRELAAEVERTLTVDDDLAAAGLAVLRALKHRSGKGVWTEPPLLDLLPAPQYEPLQRTFDLLIPDDSALAAYVIADDRRAVLASVIAVKRKGDIALVTTHAAIADLVPEAALARDWAGAHKRVTRAIGERLARPALAVFLERATIDKLIVGPPDTLGREVNAKRIILDPAPAWLLGLLGSATVAAMAQRGASALAALLPQATRDRASELAGRARTAMRESGAHPFALLGFDPIALLLAVREYYRPRA